MKLTPAEATAALAEVEAARATMRHVIRAHRGHLHLWIWGVAWIVMPLLVHFRGESAMQLFPWIALAGGVASATAGFTQASQIRLLPSARFLGMLAALLVFALVFPFVLITQPEPKAIYAYICLVAMQAYVVAGLWTDTYLLWLGLAITALILVGLFVFPAVFWLWMAAFSGGSLLVSGFYVRRYWR